MTEALQADANWRTEQADQDMPPVQLNDAQKLHLRVSCQYMDQLLQDVEGILHSQESETPFPKYQIDLSPAQGRVLEDYIRRLRAQLVRALAWQQIAPPLPNVPATRAISTRLHFIDNALADMRPKEMRGSGTLSDAAATELSGVVHELESLVENMMNYIHQELDASLEDRIGKLEIEGQEQDLLRRIEGVVTRRGLVEFRPRLDILLSRLEDRSFEVALFGRVSSGKSSFLNALLSSELLPIGVNPITAVPTRIRYGQEIAAFLRFGNREPIRVSLEEFRMQISESGNPGNQHAVTRALLEVPSSRLSAGIVLVDTPGLGSLAQSGAAETMAYLPACDLALVLIDAGSTMTAEDIGTLRVIQEAGIPSMILISKSDLLGQDDIRSTIQYVEERIKRELRIALPIHAISATQERRRSLDQFFQSELWPRFQRAQILRVESVARKLNLLRRDVIVSLETKLQRITTARPGVAVNGERIESLLRAITNRIGELGPRLDRRIIELRGASPRLLESLANEIALEVSTSQTDTVLPIRISERLHEIVNREVEPLIEMIQDATTRVVEDTRGAGIELGRADLPANGGMDHLVRDAPRFEIAYSPESIRLGLWKHLGVSAIQFRVRKNLNRQLALSLQEDLSGYASVFTQWSMRLARALQFEINSFVDVYRAVLQEPDSSGTSRIEPLDIGQDIDALSEPATNGVAVANELRKGEQD